MRRAYFLAFFALVSLAASGAVFADDPKVFALEGFVRGGLATKTNKVVPAAAGNIATLDASGNLADGGVAASGLATAGAIAAAITAAAGNYATTAQGAKADAALPRAGGTMTGPIILSGAPTETMHAATKQYVDAAVSGAGDSVSANMYAFGAYQGIYSGSMANWVPDSGNYIIVKKIGSGTTGEIAIRLVGAVVCIVPKDLTPSAYLMVDAGATASGATVAAAPGVARAARTADADGLHIIDNEIIILRQPPTLTNAVGNFTLYYAVYNDNRTRQPWDYNIMTYDGGVLSIGAHSINMRDVAAGGSKTWTGGSI